jgi:hypothetical protein
MVPIVKALDHSHQIMNHTPKLLPPTPDKKAMKVNSVPFNLLFLFPTSKQETESINCFHRAIHHHPAPSIIDTLLVESTITVKQALRLSTSTIIS